ncbi:cytochrome b-c1 complex subunit 10-like [Tribolium madens]|uniref:cytochrome b-c1 complex subunit 10-like n=1 Tax=Tribolium madens TaxID=41895 RepID=UPI001CF75909|nr:cytochrome b-c1 complex subunit 10-like [Tribolium madens]
MSPAVRLPGPLRLIGKKHIEIASQWIGSAIAFGATAGVGITYATDWKLVLQFMPYYNGKFKEEE